MEEREDLWRGKSGLTLVPSVSPRGSSLPHELSRTSHYYGECYFCNDEILHVILALLHLLSVFVITSLESAQSRWCMACLGESSSSGTCRCTSSVRSRAKDSEATKGGAYVQRLYVIAILRMYYVRSDRGSPVPSPGVAIPEECIPQLPSRTEGPKAARIVRACSGIRSEHVEFDIQAVALNASLTCPMLRVSCR